jgi:ABC-type transport system involved in multi-copper enzyme maturation permease subunit
MSVLPIVDRELRVASRRKGTYWLRSWAALAMLLLWLVVLLNSNFRLRPQLGHYLLVSLGVLALVMSMLAGVFLTSDSLSEEKREGTLGLLFLTDLKAYDVVLGKMAAHSIHAFFGLLAVLPILGLTILMGGVTGAEFMRVALVFIVTLFFSLSLGMAVSAGCRDARQAIAGTFFMMLVFAGILPAIWWLQRMTINSSQLDFLLMASPVVTYMASLDTTYKLMTGARFFWESLGTLLGLGLCSILLANFVLPRAWQDKNNAEKEKKRAKVSDGPSQKPGFAPLELFRRYEPAFWLAVRDASPRLAAWRLFFLLLPFWACALVISVTTGWSHQGFTMALFVAYGLHFATKVLMAVEASRRMNQDRRNGAWELLLVTPLRVDSILAGQRKAMWRHFRGIIAALLGLNFSMMAVALIFHEHLSMSADDRLMFGDIFAGGAAVLVMDFYALGWVGMWRGLNARQHHSAVVATLGQIMGLPLVFIFLLIVMEPAFRGISGPIIAMALWFGISMALDLASGMVARKRLLAEFRARVAARNG